MKGKSNAAGRAPQQPQVKTYLTQNVTVFEYNPVSRENKPQGQFTLMIQGTSNGSTFTVHRQGCAAPLVSFALSRQINWTLQNNVYVYFTDSRKSQWLLQFPDAASAGQATALICLLVAVTSGKDVTRYEAQQLVQGKPVSEGDNVCISFWVFTFNPWPFVQPVLASKENFTTPLMKDKLPMGVVDGINGMVVGNSRAIFVPRNMTALMNGQRDPSFADKNIIVVVNLLSAEYIERKELPTPAPAPQVQPQAQPQVQPQAQPQIQPQVQPQAAASSSRRSSLADASPDIGDIGVISLEDTPGAGGSSARSGTAEPVAEEPIVEEESEPEMDPEEAERLRKIEKMKALGAINPMFGGPSDISRTRRPSESSESSRSRRQSEASESSRSRRQSEVSEVSRARRPSGASEASRTRRPSGASDLSRIRRTSDTSDVPNYRRGSVEEANVPRMAASQYPSAEKRHPIPSGLAAAMMAPSGAPSTRPAVDPNKSPLENRIDSLERTLGAKLDSVTGAGTDAGSVVTGVTSLVAFVKMKQLEIERLKEEIEKARSAPSRQVSVQSLDTMKKESERIHKSNLDLERGLAQVDAKIRDMEGALRTSRESAISREKTLMKRLMGNVFEDVQNVFEEKRLYSGAQVEQMLKKLMREQSFSILTDIDENGLF